MNSIEFESDFRFMALFDWVWCGRSSSGHMKWIWLFHSTILGLCDIIGATDDLIGNNESCLRTNDFDVNGVDDIYLQASRLVSVCVCA